MVERPSESVEVLVVVPNPPQELQVTLPLPVQVWQVETLSECGMIIGLLFLTTINCGSMGTDHGSGVGEMSVGPSTAPPAIKGQYIHIVDLVSVHVVMA